MGDRKTADHGDENRRTIDAATLSLGAAFLRSAHWIARVFDPRRPPLPQIAAWSEAICAAEDETDPRKVARRSQPNSLLAQRLAYHLSVLLVPPTPADLVTCSAHVVLGARLQELTLALVDKSGIPIAGYCQVILHSAWPKLENAFGGRIQAYVEYRRILDAVVPEIDHADTEAKIREERLAAHLRRSVAA